jgi:outer membrane murein-binding lipoprotein Lpp
MTRPPLPTPAAKERLQALGEAEIEKFISEVSALRRLVQFLPRVDGFRKDSKAGIERQKRELARRISSRSGRAAAQDVDYRSFYALWRAWLLERTEDSKAVIAALDAIDEAAGVHDSESRTLKSRTAAADLFAVMAQRSVDSKVSREDIQRAFQLSFFDDSDAIRTALDRARTAEEIKRSTEYESIPNRLNKDEQEISAIREQVAQIVLAQKGIVQKIDRLGSAVDGWSVQKAGLLSALTDLEAAVDRRFEAQEAHAKSVKLSKFNATDAEIKSVIEPLNKRIDHLSRTLAAFSTSNEAAQLEATRAHARLEAVENQLASRQKQDHEERDDVLATLVQQVTSLEERLAREIKVRLAGTTDAALVQRLNSIEQALARAEASHPPAETVAAAAPAVSATPADTIVHAEIILQRGRQPPLTITAFQDACQPMGAMFQQFGLKATAAKALAEEVCVAAFLGQVTFFKGAYAAEAALGCSNLLCNGQAYRVALPLGVHRPDDLRRALVAEAKDNDLLAAFVIEGVNLGAFEILKDVLSELTSDDTSQKSKPHGGALVFATITEGVASLSVESSYFELGPVFDLDCLDWRLKRQPVKEQAVAVLPRATRRTIRERLTEVAVDSEEAQRLIQSFSRKRNPRIEHAMLAAFSALSACRKNNELPTALQSLAYGWLLPLWAARRVSKSEADVLIDGGKCDAQSSDERLTPLLDELAPVSAESA